MGERDFSGDYSVGEWRRFTVDGMTIDSTEYLATKESTGGAWHVSRIVGGPDNTVTLVPVDTWYEWGDAYRGAVWDAYHGRDIAEIRSRQSQ